MPQVKFGRNYSLSVQASDGSTITIAPPFTVEFDITRNVYTSANVCQIRIYNLSQNNRNLIRFDFSNYGQVRSIQFRAGYGDNLALIFAGNISQAWSVRESTNYITTIECFDGGYAFVNGISNRTFGAGTTQEAILRALISDLPGISFGAISSNYIRDASGSPFVISRGAAYSGNTANILGELTGGGFFIDNSKAYCLGNNSAFVGSITQINSSTGLLGTPVREQTIVNFDMIFEPRIQVGQEINLQSTTVSDANVNGVYKVISVKHRGMISPAVSGNAITSIGFFYGTQSLQITEVS